MLEKINTNIIGDGQLPNKYIVSVSNSFYIFENETLNWYAGQGFTLKSETVASFTSYYSAKEYVNSCLYLGQKQGNFTVNSIFIEDRISGELYCCINCFYPKECKKIQEVFEDMGFTEKKLGNKFN